MIDAPLSRSWRYDLGHRKIFELRSALGLSAEGPAPMSAVFAYAIVPGLARMLTDPTVAADREELRLARVETAFASELDMRGELICGIEIASEVDVIGIVSCRDEREARSVVTIHLRSGEEEDVAPAPMREATADEIHLDAARCMAFAAATWDLNPAYWDRELAEAAGLGGLVAPPGLTFALALGAIERRAGRILLAADVRFHRAGRPGDVLSVRSWGAPAISFEVARGEDLVLSGTAMLGGERVAL